MIQNKKIEIIILYKTNKFKEKFLINFKKNLIVKYEKMNEQMIVVNRMMFCSKLKTLMFPDANTVAPNKAGMERKKEILLESYLLNPKNLPAVITIPALLTPGINANT